MNFDDVWKRICDVTGWRSYGELALFLEIKAPSVSGAKSRGVFPFEWAFKVARSYKVSTDWLLTGEGPMKRGEASGTSPPLDEELLQAVLEAVEEYLDQVKGRLKPAKKAQLVAALYDMFNSEEEKAVDRATVIRLVKLAV